MVKEVTGSIQAFTNISNATIKMSKNIVIEKNLDILIVASFLNYFFLI